MNPIRSCFPCLLPCVDCEGTSYNGSVAYSQFGTPYIPSIRLDVSRMGKDVVILKEGERICGTGGSIATVPIVQNKAYFQVTIQQTGTWGIGLGHKQTSLDAVPAMDQFWGIRENGDLVASGEIVKKMAKNIEEGDTVGVSYDHVELTFFVNGVRIDETITGVKGPVYPMLYVDDSAILDIKFKNFSYPPPSGFSEILVEQTLL